MTLKQLYDTGTEILDEAGIDSPETDAFYLLEHVTGTDMSGYLLNKNKEQEPETEAGYIRLINLRAEHIPYQYIIGEADFMGYKIHVTPDVLIPRLDTEVLCDEAVKLIRTGSEKVLDMCTGSGCIAIAVKCICPGTDVTACDISDAALSVAEKNAVLNGADITFVRSDLFEEIGENKFDIIISNPPYVTESEYITLSPEVRDHEPVLALTAGADGLDIYRRLIPKALAHLKSGGHLIMEIGCSQGSRVLELMEDSGYKDIKIIKDFAGLDRVISGRTVV